ncbi:MAG: pyridoxine 5'-phosphate synthase [Verrucomicrobia bacterium]|nr:pyridoxine 5'-phosphate synthase [Verrucomicrobiota bacterium]MCH8526094.1 pyridoxine 5'-phosphate synthase [Kiritimatiellia bacterium]
MYLGVNVDHVATIRQARGTPYPDPVDAARLAAEAGAAGITVHLREDRRHIQDRDVWAMRREQPLPLNLEMGNTEEMVAVALAVKPDEVCLVPEKRAELTTEGGLDVAGNYAALEASCVRFREAGIAVSLFVDPDPVQIEASIRLGVPMVELHTGAFCECEGAERRACVEALHAAAVQAHAAGIQVNAGHGLTVENLPDLFPVPYLHTLNIGHSLVARAVLIGMKAAVAEMLAAMKGYTGGITR